MPVKITASNKNCLKISRFAAPSAFLNPISRVLSVTATSIIFIMPIPPTTREIAAIETSKSVKMFVTVPMRKARSACVWTKKSSFSGSVIPCEFLKVIFKSSTTFGIFSSVSAEMIKRWKYLIPNRESCPTV